MMSPQSFEIAGLSDNHQIHRAISFLMVELSLRLDYIDRSSCITTISIHDQSLFHSVMPPPLLKCHFAFQIFPNQALSTVFPKGIYQVMNDYQVFSLLDLAIE